MSNRARDGAYWTVPEREFRGLTPERARDLIAECFFQAQHETFERAKQRVGSADTDEKAIRAAVTGAIRVAFKESGGDYEKPTPASLARMVEVLVRKAGSWGTPDEIVAHHRAQIGRMLTVLGAPLSA
jgi:cation transport regulator ChaB